MHVRVAALLSLALVALLAPTTTAADKGGVDVPRFVEETKRSGIDHVYDGGWEFLVGGGIAAFDCDADGLAELYVAGGEGPAALYRNDSKTGGALRFSAIDGEATGLDSAIGAYPLDIDSDGLMDLAVLRVGENTLLRGLGECRFEHANETWGFDGGDTWTTAFSAKWEGPAQLPTLALGDYLEQGTLEEGLPWNCLDGELVRPTASGFAYDTPEALTPGFCSLSMLFSDWDRSGRGDLRISNDRQYYPDTEGMEQLWRVAPGEPARLYTDEDGWQPLRLWGMGIASHDVTGDGYPEVYLSSIGPNRLQTLADESGQPMFGDISRELGVVATNPVGDKSLPSTAWHDEFEDVNNDGLVDLYVAKGNVNEMAENAMADPSVLFLGLPDGTFIDRARKAGIKSPERGRGAAVVDLNLDGLLDVVQLNRRDRVQLWRNVGSGTAKRPRPMGDWLALRLSQAGANPDAVGAWIEVETPHGTQTREVTVGGGHAGGQLGWVHFGLGDTRDARIRVQWPDGEWGPWHDMRSSRFYDLERGSEPARWKPADD